MTIPVYVWSKQEAQIIKAAAATDEGRRALELVVEHLCGLRASVYDDHPQRMAMMEGRRSVAIDLRRAMLTPIDKLIPEVTDDRRRTLTATERADAAASSGGRSTR